MKICFFRRLRFSLSVMVFLQAAAFPAGAQRISKMDFKGQAIVDILQAFSKVGGVSIVPDETVRGTASFFLADSEYQDAFAAFLSSAGLFARTEGGVCFVSRISVELKEDDGSVRIDAEDVEILMLSKAISKRTGKAVFAEELPRDAFSFHASAPSLQEMMLVLSKRFSGFELESGEGYFRFRRQAQAQPTIGYGYDPGSGFGPGGLNLAGAGTESIPLDFLDAGEAAAYLPAEMASGGLKVDKANNAIIVTGSPAEIENVKKVLAALDIEDPGKDMTVYRPLFIKTKDALAAMPDFVAAAKPIAFPDGSGFILRASPEVKKAVDGIMAALDRRSETRVVRLKYIQYDELLTRLPPSASKEDLLPAGDPAIAYFVGPDGKYDAFKRDLEAIDRPKAMIRYDLLVIQFDRTAGRTEGIKHGLTWGADTDGLTPFSASGTFENLLNLKFDVVSSLGLSYSATLDLTLKGLEAKVCTDTSLAGLSGTEVRLQNTSTIRYRDPFVDDKGEIQNTGITRELSSGLTIAVNGWVSGDGMVTMDVNASVSQRASDYSTESANLPMTKERVLKTKLSTPSGTPVVVSGLTQTEQQRNVTKIPLLGDIPLLGWFFRTTKEEEVTTEFVIYLIPRVVMPEGTGASAELEMERMYATYGR